MNILKYKRGIRGEVMVIKNKKGITLLEVMVVVLIIGIVISTIMSIVVFGYRVYNKESSEYDIQTKVRLTMEEMNKLMRSSKAVFAIPNADYLDEQWNYISVSEDNTKIINYKWDNVTKTHKQTVLTGPFEGVEFDISFFKNSNMESDNTVKLRLEATVNGVTKRFDILTGYEALNSLQVIDYGTEANPAKTLAYRGDDFHYENMKIYVNIAVVLDTSGSMNWNLAGGTARNLSDRRITILKNQTKNLIDQLYQNENDDVIISTSLIQYNTHANNPSTFMDVRSQRQQIKNSIDSLCRGNNQDCSGGTNTGDGLRRAYHLLEQKTADIEATQNYAMEDITVKNYVILLTDGDYTLYSREITPSGSFNNFQICTSSIFGYCLNWSDYSIPIPTRSFYLGTQNITGTGVNYYKRTSSSVQIERNVLSKSVVSDSASDDFFYIENGVGNYVFGHGSNLDSIGLTYIQQVADLGLNNNSEYTNFIIAFTESVSVNAINNIKAALNVDSSRVFSAKSEAELGMSFTNIQTSITNDTWHYLGPKLVE